jgi:hypothetical protein
MAFSDEKARQAIVRLDQWLQSAGYAAYDPFDGLNAWVRPLAFNGLSRQILQQGVKRFPGNLRPLLGIRPAPSTKGMGYIARAYLKLYAVTGEADWVTKARYCLDWLRAHPSPGYADLSWGNHFDYQSRVFYLPEGEPTVVWTAHIAFAFLDAWELFHEREDLEAVESVCRFVLDELERRPEGKGICISYVPGSYHCVHNASMLAAAALARAYSNTGNEVLKQVSSQAVAYTVHAQRNDGAWWYGEAENLHWVDSFHTGYVLDCLWWYMASTGDYQYRAAFDRGALFFVESFFLDDGTPKYYADKTYPTDIQCAAQAIETLSLLARVWDPTLRALAERVAGWTVTNMQDPDGHFYFQRGSWWVNKTPMLHWGQATMLHALACLLKVDGNDEN